MSDTAPAFDFGKLLAIGAGMFNPLAGELIGAFEPLVQDKITSAIGKHTDATTAANIGASLSNVVVQAAQQLTGKSDPLQAVAAAAADPVVLAKVQQSALDELDRLAPYLDKIHSYSKDEWAASDASQAAAFERNKDDPSQNIQHPLMTFTFAAVGISTLFVGGLLGLQVYLKSGEEPNGQLIILFVMLVTTFVNMLRTQNDWGFGSSRQSAAKDLTIDRLSRKQ